MRKHGHGLVTSLTILAVFLGLSVESGWAAAKMPAFTLEHAVTGERIDSSSFKGKSLLVTFFATWCPPCIQEIPTLKALQNEYRERGFSVVGLAVDQEGKQVVERLAKRKKINYPIMMADAEVTRDFGGVYGIPTSFLINSRGTVVKRYTGYVPKAVLVRDIEQVIK